MAFLTVEQVGALLRMRQPPLDPKDPNTEKVVSLYNMLFGRNPMSRLLLSMLNLTEENVGRFRDCYLFRGDPRADEKDRKPTDELRIVIYTRNGGGNRDSYESATDLMQNLPGYICDYDDDYDCTYASYEFKVPEKFKATATELAELGGEPGVSPQQKFQSLIEKMQSGQGDDPDVKRALEVGKQILGPIMEQLNKGT